MKDYTKILFSILAAAICTVTFAADKPNCKKTGKNCPMNDNKLLIRNAREHGRIHEQHSVPEMAVRPSLIKNGISASAATLSNHHQPNSQVAANPTMRTMER